MGTDIHLKVERKEDDGSWRLLPDPIIDCPDYLHDQAMTGGEGAPCYWCKGTGKRAEAWYRNRNYDAFAILADVRNGPGFGGVDTGDGFVPIAQPRGFPDDLSPETEKIRIYDNEDFWFGDHSYSWVLASEVLDALDTRTTKRRGWVNPEEFVQFKKTGQPGGWCGGVSGPNIEHVSNEEMERRIASGKIKFKGPTEAGKPAFLFGTVYTLVEWGVTYAEAASDLKEAVERLVAAHGPADRLRLLFGFDS